MFKSVLVLAYLASSVVADYFCQTNLGKFTIQKNWADAAVEAGGTITGVSGFPHEFHGLAGKGKAQLKFYGADPRCNQKDPDLYEYPVMQDGQKYPKNVKHGTTKTPARVVYLHQDGKILCGVMTHVIEDKSTHQGTGDFRVCDP